MREFFVWPAASLFEAGRVLLPVAVVLYLAACAARPAVVETRTVDVLVPLAVPCALARPAMPAALRDRYSDADWQALDLRQKAAAVSAAGLARLNHAENLQAATAACPEITD